MLRPFCLFAAIVCAATGAWLVAEEYCQAASCIISCHHFTYACDGSDDIDACILYTPPQAHDNIYGSSTDGTMPVPAGGTCAVYEGPGGTRCPNISPGITQECVTCVPMAQFPNVTKMKCYGSTTTF